MTDIYFRPISSIVTFNKGKPPAKLPYHGPDAMPYLTPEYLRGKSSFEYAKPNPNAALAKNGDTVVLWDGSNAGEVFLGRAGLLASTMSLVSHSEDFNRSYFFYSLKKWEYYLKGQTSGSGIPHVDKEIIGKLELCVLPLNEQNKIAHILSTVDRAIEQTEALIAKQQRIKSGLMQDLLTRGIDEQGKLRTEKTHQFKDTSLGRIPVEWGVKPLRMLCEIIKDGTHLPPDRVSEGPLLLSVQNMVNGKLTRTTADTRVSWNFYYQMHQNWEIQAEDVLLAIVGATIGKTCLAPANFEPYTLQRSVGVIRGKKGILYNRYLLHYFRSPFFQLFLHTKTNSTAQAGLYLSQIADFYIPTSSIEEQIAINSQLEKISNLIEYQQDAAEKLKSLKTALMQDLLTGRKRVTTLLYEKEMVNA